MVPFAQCRDGRRRGPVCLLACSGISFGRVDGLKHIIARVMEFLRQQIDPANPNCPYNIALKRALGPAPVSADEWARVDLTLGFASFGRTRAAIVARLTNNYARLLDVTVAGKADDYLLWTVWASPPPSRTPP